MSVFDLSLDVVEARLRAILPPQYQESFETVKPVSMGSAPLKFGSDGQVAWNEIWGSFCDLAMAGGPPHKGTLLEPAPAAAIDAEPLRHEQVLAELCRGISLATGLKARPSPVAGWVRVLCLSDAMVGWLVRAIVMENVSARRERYAIDLPAGPAFRLEKEIKNVITAIAKTCHYWVGHMSREEQRTIAGLFTEMAREWPLIEPDLVDDPFAESDRRRLTSRISSLVTERTGLRTSAYRYTGWLGLECPSVDVAIWMMRTMVGLNVLSRREDSTLFVPLNPVTDPDGDVVLHVVSHVRDFAAQRGML